MNLRYLLDTHVAVRWLVTPEKLSKEQRRVLRESVRRQEPVGISAVTLLEIAILFGEGSTRSNIAVEELLNQLQSNPLLQVVPLAVDIAAEVAAMGGLLRGPADRAIVATARVWRLRLVTSDQRIVESNLVATIV